MGEAGVAGGWDDLTMSTQDLTFDPPSLVPELAVSDLGRSLPFYAGVLGFRVHAWRWEERFVYLIRERTHLMLEEAAGPGRHFWVAPLEKPFGRGVNLQIAVADVDVLYVAVHEADGDIIIPIEERWYRHDRIERGNRQFVVADPDGYLLRFFTNLGTRNCSPDDLAEADNQTATQSTPKRRGFLAGQIQVPEDFDTMGAAEIEAMFYGEP